MTWGPAYAGSVLYVPCVPGMHGPVLMDPVLSDPAGR